jgi:DNA helicase-4
MPEMSSLHSAVEELKSLNREIANLERIRRIRGILKMLVIGFFFYRDVDLRISKEETQRDSLIRSVESAIRATYECQKQKLKAIEDSGGHLPQIEKEEWLGLIGTFEADLKYLKSLNACDSKLISSILMKIAKSRQFVVDYNENLERDILRQELLKLKDKILQAEEEFKLLYDGQRYFTKRELHFWKKRWNHLVAPIRESMEKGISDMNFQDSISHVHEAHEEGERLIEERNREYVENEILKSELFEKIEGYSLSEEQRRAVVVDEANTLVVAGAGTGKTTTLLGKAFYIVSKGLATPEEVLLVAFNRDVVKENESKINVRPGIRFTVKTYHSLGLDIIGQSRGERPTVSPLWEDSLRFGLKEKILGFLRERMNDGNFAKLVIDYFLLYYLSYKSVFEFNSLGEYYQYVKNNEVRALKGHLVKSFEECDIANYLYVNGIDYLYEEPYKFKTADSRHRQYKPDFFLPDYDIYIEHFGIDRNRKTAPWVPQDEYIEGMEWKERTHREHGTTLIKTHSFERKEGKLLSNLQSGLVKKGVVLKPLPQSQILEMLDRKVNSLASLLSTFLNLYKSSGKNLERIRTEIDPEDDRRRTFLEIFSLICEDYVEYLEKENQIDFNDMISDATSLVEQKRYISPFKYILVDEFQDISQSRYRFLRALLGHSNAKLFCVGDDWQSIYRFTGGDISIMVDFEENFGFSETRFIQETRRFGDKLCDFSTRFILENPFQIRKKITSGKKENKPAVTIIKDKTESALDKIADAIRLGTIMDANAEHPRKRLWVIGRYRDIGKPANLREFVTNNPEIEIKYRTAHSSKGLETDYVAIIGLKNGIYGFPCQIEDDPVLNLVLAKTEPMKNAEERRLFYVAMTRAKEHVYFVADEPYNVSSFVTEIENNGYEFSNATSSKLKTISCPSCKTGTIMSEGHRYGCSNSPYCDYIPRRCSECGNGFTFKDKLQYRCSNDKCSFQAKACPRCEDGYLVPRQDKYGKPFYGCSNFSTKGCRYTEEEFHRKKHYRDYVT